ncbi:MAG: hypothetical protein K5872_03140 [Rhizobiaceae bacterium]|nr:hypothetical protein [Rhizobiaceae bacterium]MCV0405204.1 hypothetical protein [Rhizobiaceae bacterium]
MPLLALWESNPSAIGEFTIEQVVSTAGDGNLRDGSLCSRELQTFLSQVRSEKLSEYVTHCLGAKFDKGGMVLQDLVNELGRRLDYDVSNGRYQGAAGHIGHDGLWKSPEGHTILVEVKTTDAYRISLDTIAGYRTKLASNGLDLDGSSILIVVGRQDTGELEAQIRGSKHAWDIRLISAEALTKLVAIKENSDEPETGTKIRSVLAPVEYTRLDKLADLMFAAATDVEPEFSASATEKADSSTEIASSIVHEMTDARLLQAKRELIIAAMGAKLETKFVRKSRALYQSADHTKRVACTISKRYETAATYWYAYHPKWDAFLSEGAESLFVLGCMDIDKAFSLPRELIYSLLPSLHLSENEKSRYWHIHISERDAGQYELVIPRKRNLELKTYEIAL